MELKWEQFNRVNLDYLLILIDLDRYKTYKWNIEQWVTIINAIRFAFFGNIKRDKVCGMNMTLLLMMMEVTAVMFDNFFFALQYNWRRIVMVRNVSILMGNAIANFNDIFLGECERWNEKKNDDLSYIDDGWSWSDSCDPNYCYVPWIISLHRNSN